MDYENFKERFVEDLKDKLYEKGIEADVSVNTVNKLNDSYEAVTIKPVDDQVEAQVVPMTHYNRHIEHQHPDKHISCQLLAPGQRILENIAHNNLYKRQDHKPNQKHTANNLQYRFEPVKGFSDGFHSVLPSYPILLSLYE